MRRAGSRIAAAAAWALLGALAVAGVGLSALVAFSDSSPGAALTAKLVVRELDGLIAGRLTLEAVELLPSGCVEVHGLRLLDPEGHLVLSAPRARIYADLTRLARRELGFAAELEAPALLLEAEPGGLSLVRALASPRAARPAPAAPREPPGRSFTLGRARLIARGGDVAWRRDGSTAVEVTGLDLDAERGFDGAGGFVGLRARARVVAPVALPFAIDAAARLRGDRLEVPVLELSLGGTSLEARGQGDLRTGAFRAAVVRLGVAAAEARRLAPAAAPGGDVSGTGYAESDGELATAALEVPPAGDPAPSGRARAAVAIRLAPTRAAVGLDVALAAFDPSLVLAQAPPGRLDLTAHGAAAGRGLSDGRGRLALALAPSRLRGGELGPVSLVARADAGVVVVEKLDARLPGLAVTARGRLGGRGAVEGDLAANATDLARLGRNLGGLGVSLPPLEGRLRARATLAGTGAAPAVTATVDAPHLVVGAARAEALSLSLDAAGPLASPRGRLAGRAARAGVGGTATEQLELAATLADGVARLSVTGAVPALGPDPVALLGAARLSADRSAAEVQALSIRWPGTRLELARPAVVTFAPPAVDRLELSDGPRSVVLAGGLGQRDEVDLRLQVVRLDVARIAPGLLPPEAAVRGELSVDARATGPARAPTLSAHLELTDGAVRGLAGLHALGDVRWDGRARLTADLGLLRAAGGALELAADVPLPLGDASGARAAAPVSLTVDASGWPVEALRQLAGVGAPVTGTVGGRLELSGTAGAPRLAAALTLADAAANGLGPLAAAVALEGASGAMRITAATRLADAPLVEVDARLPLELVELERRPAATLRGLARAPLTGAIEVPGIDLAALAGKLGLPAGLAGTVSGGATLGGTPSSPRGRGTLSLAGGAVAGYRDVAARVDVTAEAERTALAARASLGGAEALRAEGSLGAPIERLSDPAVRRAAPLSLDATVPALALPRGDGPAPPLAGTISAHLSAKGTLARPEARLESRGEAVEVQGRPLGDFTAVVRQDGPSSTAEVSLRPATGGTLRGEATVVAPLGLGDPKALREAKTTVRVTSDALELGFVAAVAPTLVRSASGRLTLDLSASGPLARLRPRGAVKLEGGRLAVVGLGEWSEVELVASLGERAIELSRLEARRGAGRVTGKLSLNDLGTPTARLDGRLALRQLTVVLEGVELATLDLPIAIEGSVTDALLDATVTLAEGTIRLPRKSSGALQSLDERSDITDADAAAERARRLGAAPAPEPPPRAPFAARCRVLIPGKLLVKGERPAVNLELKGDSTWRVAGRELTAGGSVEVVRGTVEPIAGRVFHVERARVTFPDAGVKAGQLDVVARYENPAAVVTVTIGGTVAKPSLQLSSNPSMDDAAIAMLIATGRAEMNLGTTGTSTVNAQEAGAAVASAAVGAAFTGLVAGRLPVDQLDQLSVDTNWVRAGKYVTDKLFVGYAYNFDAKQEEGENTNEVKAEYKISPRWNFELRYGDAPAGNASLVWSKDY